MLRKNIFPLIHQFGLWLVRITEPEFVNENLTSPHSAEPPMDQSEPMRWPYEIHDVQAAQDDVKGVIGEPAIEAPAQSMAERPPVESGSELTADFPSQDFLPPALNSHREVEVAAVCKVLTVLEKQLQEVNSDVESSVQGVCQGFYGMAQRAQEALNAAEEAIGQPSDSGTKKDLISQMRTALVSLVKNVQASSEFSQAVSQKLGALESRLAAVEHSLKDVESIAKKAKFVAFNGQIEAARLGDSGRAVAVVAKETKALASEAAQTSDAIRNLVNQLAQELKSTSIELKQRTDDDVKRFVESDQLARSLLDDIHLNHQKIATSLEVSGKISGELRNDISQAVVSMQFQDRVSQRIAHVIETLELLIDRVHPKLPDDGDEEVAVAWFNEISARYTMDSERRLLNLQGPHHGNFSSSKADESSVELF